MKQISLLHRKVLSPTKINSTNSKNEICPSITNLRRIDTIICEWQSRSSWKPGIAIISTREGELEHLQTRCHEEFHARKIKGVIW